MSPAGTTLRALIAAARRRLRRDTAITIVAAVLTVAPIVLLLAWLLAGVTVWAAPTWLPLVLELIALSAAVALAVWGLRRWSRGLGEPDVAATAEAKLGLPAGSVRGILELGRTVPQGTSSALFSREEARIARHFVGQRPRELSGPLGARVRRRRLLAVAILGGLAIVTGTLGFMSPERSMRGWGPLLQPVAYLTPPPLPALVVSPGDTEVTRGSDVRLRVTAPGRSAVVVTWRVEGDVPRRATFEVTDGTALGVVPQVDAPTVYWVEAADGARSDRYRITPIDPLLVSELIVEVRYPEYMGRAPERFEVEVPALEVPQGTELVIRGRATRSLGSADLVAATGRRVRLNIEGDGFSGRWKPTTSGTYEWRLTDQQDVNLSTAPTPIDIAIAADAAPEVEITFPGVDTVLDAAMMQPIMADARDDNGIAGAWLVSWRVGANGEREEPVEQPVRAAALDHALLRTALDASERNLTGGDTLKYFIRVADNSPGRQTAVSSTYSLWLPGRAEMRERAVEQARAAIESAEQLAASAQRLAETTRGVQRSTSSRGGGGQSRSGGGGSPGSNGESQSLDFETAEQVRSALDQQQQMLGDLETQRRQLESMDRAMESAGLRDPQLQQRLQELRDLYDQILTPELKEKLEELREALNQMDPEDVQKAVEQLAKEQEALEEQLDRSLELLRKAAAEQQMNALAEEARELSTQQEALAESMKEMPPTPEQSEMQKQLEERTDSLRRNIEQLQQKLGEQGETQASEQAGEASKQVGEASQSMGDAAKNAQEQKGDQASESGQEAADKLNEAAEKLEAARKSMAASRKKEVGDSVEQATNDALSIAQRQQSLLERMQQAMGQESGQQQGGEQDSGQQQGSQQQGGEQQGGQQQGGQQQGGQKQGGQQQGGQQQGGQKQGGQKQGGQQQGGQQQGGQQQGGQQQGGQQQGGQQQGGQQQGGQQQGGQQQGGQQQGGQQQGGQQQGGQQQGGQQQGGQQQNGDGTGEGGSDELRSIQSEQAALQQSLEQLGRNLSETGERSPLLNRDVGSALGRANLSMQKTMESLARAGEQGTMPTEEAAQTVDALNRLALALLNNAQQIEDSQDGTGLQDSLEQLTELAQKQGSLSGRSQSLLPMNVAPQAMAKQMGRLARDQRQIADQLGGMNSMRGAREDALGQLDELVREANRITRELEGSRLTPDIVARQERLFHRLLEAGRTYEREETSDERVAERPGAVEASRAESLDPLLFEDGTRYRAPTPEELRNLSPAYRRLILEYFERLNRTADAARAAEARER